ncbi:MAG: ATP synthase F1 subunit epsilon [Nannocystaceae bacterium]|nr:ATP synthase F1 subunit epsilon [Nannocystaceae bacterium]
MSDTAIKLDILTPMGAIRDGIDVPGVEVPGVLGELGILPRHESLITAIVPGVVRFREGGNAVKLAVGSGFVEVKEAGRVIILCDRAVEAGGVDKSAVQSRLAEVRSALERERGPIEAAEFRALQDERAWLEAQLRL